MKHKIIPALFAVPALLLAFSAQAYDTKTKIKGGAGYNDSPQATQQAKQHTYAIADKTRRTLHRMDISEETFQVGGDMDRRVVSDKTRRTRF